MLLRGDLDFCLSAPPSYFQLDPELAAELLFSETDAIIVRKEHPLAGGPRRDLAALRAYPWIMSAQLTATWKRICREFTGAGLAPPEQLIRTDSIALARELVLLGDYLVLLARENVARELEHGLLREIFVPRIPDTRPAILTTRHRTVQQPAAFPLATTTGYRMITGR